MKSDPEGGSVKPAPMFFSCRLALFILCLFSTFTFMLLRINIGFALVCMVKRPNVTLIGHQNYINTNKTTYDELATLGNDNDSDHIARTIIHNFSSDLDNNAPLLSDSSEFTLDNKEGSGTREAAVFQNISDILNNLIQETFDESEDEQCKRIANSNSANSSHLVDQGEFEWSREVQGSILGSFYYGYLFTQISGGWLAERFGARIALLGSLLSLSLLTLLNPLAASHGPEFLFGVRLLMGLTHGAALSSINIFSVRWCGPAERAFLMGIAYGGFCIAAAFTFPICAFLCQNFGWPFIFYVTGSFGLIVASVAYFLVYDWPEDHPRITERELTYLQKCRAVKYTSGKASKKFKTPWKKILLSIPINVVHITHACFVWGFLMIGMYLPTFMKEVLYLDTGKNGLYSSLPYMAMLIVHFSVGSIFDFLRRKNFFTLTNLRKLFNTIGMLSPAIALILTGFLSCSSPGAGIIVISIAQAFAEFGFMGGYMFSIFELAPKYAGVLTGITNTFGVLPGFLCPAFVAYMTPNGSREEWIVVFLLAGGMNIFGAMVYLIFGSSVLQSWAAPDPSKPNGKEMVTLQEKLLKIDDANLVVSKSLVNNGSGKGENERSIK